VLEAGYHELNRVQMPAVSLLTKKLAAAHQEARGGRVRSRRARQRRRRRWWHRRRGGGASSGVWRRYDVMVCKLLRLVSLLRKGALTLASLEYLVPDKAAKLLELGFLEQRDEVLAACDGATV
jgi:hypothetical protein